MNDDVDATTDFAADPHADATGYALGSLDPTATAAFERHLAGCQTCQDEVTATLATATQLSAVVEVEPPAGLRSAVLAQLDATPQEAAPTAGRHAGPAPRADETPALVAPAEPVAADPVAAAGTDSGPTADVVPIRRSWGVRAGALLAAAAVLGAVGFGAWALQSRNDARDQTTTANAQVEQLTSLLAAPDVQTGSTAVVDGGTATVIRSAQQGKAMLVTADLPDLPDGKVYEAWTIKKDTPKPAGTFGAADTPHDLPAAAVDTNAIAVTVEPEGGSEEPTTDPIAVIDLST